MNVPSLPPLDRRLYASPVLIAGTFRARPGDPRFADSGAIERDVFVFPRRFVTIQHEGGSPFVAGPNEITFYNRGQRYRRGRVSPDGDRCAWFSFAPEILRDAIAAVDPSVGDRPDRPFAFTHGPSSAGSYLRQAEVIRSLLSGAIVDLLSIEETMLAVLERAIADAYAARSHVAPRAEMTERSRRELVERAKRVLAEAFRHTLGLSEIAARAGSSVFHLCRVFRRLTGFSLHEYRNGLRLRAALDDLSADLTGLALELGYSSHSHFTAAFRKEFGVPPSVVRQRGQREAGGVRL